MDAGLDKLILSELDRLYRFAYNRTHDAYKAEELTQDIVLTAYRAYPKLCDKKKAAAWLWGIARNAYMQSFKTSGEIPTDVVLITDIAGVSLETPETEYLRQEDIRRVRAAVSFLAKNYRDVCVMFYLENRDYNAIAYELGIPLSSVKWRLNRSKSLLREEYSKMDYMANGYRKAVQLKLNMGGYVGKYDFKSGAYDNADKALDGLLSQNICVVAYESPKTVTEISSELGVAADYVEDSLKKLVTTQSVRQTGNKYQTMFPIWDEAESGDVFDGNIEYAIKESKEIVDTIISASDKIRTAGFYGCEKDINRLLVFLIGYVCHNTEHNSFETDKLPFHGNDKAWYILAFKGKSFCSRFYDGNGISSSGSPFGLREFYFSQKYVKDNRSGRKEEQKAFYDLYLGNPVADDYSLAKLVEDGKVQKAGDAYKIAVPVISEERGDAKNLSDALAPVLKKTNALQKKIYTRSCETVRKHTLKHLADTVEFFGGYCAHSILETALFEELVSRNIKITNDMVTWYTVK